MVEKASGRFGRDRFRCTPCQNVGNKCLTWSSGGYCNGLARTETYAHDAHGKRREHKNGSARQSVAERTTAH